MSKPYFCAVIGKGFGDEGKGMAVDFLSSCYEKTLVIRHNGGAQSGHTVDLPDKRFVFHELSSGSFRDADTFWAETYFPDLYKLGEEAEAFCNVSGFIPNIYAAADTSITIIDDVLVNMAAESARGAKRHGSCGMGIYEAQCRSEAGFKLTMKELQRMSEEELVNRLTRIRNNYLPGRLAQLNLTEVNWGEYGELLQDKRVLENAAREMLHNLKYVKVIHREIGLFEAYDCVVFENGQGLLLDAENATYSPHVTASRTGLTNPCEFVKKLNLELNQIIYVTRSYVTRHGAGPLPNECKKCELGMIAEDQTNQENDWQGCLRYARHDSVAGFTKDIQTDLQQLEKHQLLMPKKSLLITHLNETDNQILCEDQAYHLQDFCHAPSVSGVFDEILMSSTHFSRDIQRYDYSSGGNN